MNRLSLRNNRLKITTHFRGIFKTLDIGPVYTSSGHGKKGHFSIVIGQNATLDRWVSSLDEENNGGKLFSWMIK